MLLDSVNNSGFLWCTYCTLQEAGAAFVTLHARTRRQTYEGRADWSLVRRARQLLRIPVIGNGDVVSVETARQLLDQSGCHGLMIGRGAVQVSHFQYNLYGTFVH